MKQNRNLQLKAAMADTELGNQQVVLSQVGGFCTELCSSSIPPNLLVQGRT